MRTRQMIVAAALVGATAVAAPGHAAGCVVLTDPPGDVMVLDRPEAVLPDGHVDVRSVEFDVSERRLRATIMMTQLVEGRLGEWRVGFRNGDREMYVGAGLGMWVNIGHYHGTFRYVAGVQGRRSRQVSGSIDFAAGTIIVDAPLSAFGGIAAGDVLSDFRIVSKETVLNLGTTEYRLSDTAASPATVAVAGC